MEENEMNNDVYLEYGDIIEIYSNGNEELDKQTFLINYIDKQKVSLINVATLETVVLYFKENGSSFRDESIYEIHIVSKTIKKGYIAQNNLTVKKWIEIYFYGENVAFIGEITNIEEDKMEITLLKPIQDKIYIDFEYKGIPDDLLIEKITIIPKPETIKKSFLDEDTSTNKIQNEEPKQTEENEEQQEANVQYTIDNEMILLIPEKIKYEENTKDIIGKLIVPIFEDDDKTEYLYKIVELNESKKIYGLDEQITNLLDELLSTIPTHKRNKKVILDIQRMIERFKQLRIDFSKTDTNNNIIGPNILGENHKPLVEKLQTLNTKIQWIIPIVSLKKKLFSSTIKSKGNEDEIEDIPTIDNIEVINIKKQLQDISEIQENYSKKKNEGNVKYETMCKLINDLFIPYLNPEDRYNIIFHSSVHANIETIVETSENYNSIVFSKDTKVDETRFVIQKFIGGEMDYKRQDKKIDYHTTIQDERINIKSLLFLPFQMIEFSRIENPTTSIMDRSLYSQNYPLLFRILNSNIKTIDKQFVPVTEKYDMNFEDLEKKTNIPMFSICKEFAIESRENENYDDSLLNSKYESYLNNVIPKTFDLIGNEFKLFEKMIHHVNGYSFNEMIKLLEPFMIHTKDITNDVYVKINQYVENKIVDYIEKCKKYSREYKIIRDEKFRTQNTLVDNSIIKIFKENENLKTSLLDNYFKRNSEITTDFIGSSSYMSNVLNYDYGTLFYTLIQKMNTSLKIPKNLIDAIKPPDEQHEITEQSNCTRRFIAKRYKSLKDLQNDNHVLDVYYDKEFDKTPYELLKDYKKEKQQMKEDVFLEFFAENLVQKHQIPKEISKEMAETIIRGKKKIQVGEYAVLETYPSIFEDNQQLPVSSSFIERTYYKRTLKNVWKKEENTSEQDYYFNDNNLFCNLTKTTNCLKRKTDVCEDTEQARQKILNETRKRLFKEFDTQIEQNVETMKEELEKEIEQKTHILLKTSLLQKKQLYKYNDVFYSLGRTIQKDEIELQSPYMKTLDLILSQEEDFVKKQKNIITFVDRFTREPLVERLNEHPDWYYCKVTNTKLIPIYIYELSKAYINGGSDDYLLKLKEVIRKYGEKSDDNDAIVDKLSGRVIQKIDFVEEEQYDKNGFRIKTRDAIQEDITTIIKKLTTTKPTIEEKRERIFEDDETQLIYNIFITICNNIDVVFSTQTEDNILRIINETMKQIVMKKETFERKEKEKKNAKPKSYEKYKNQTIILLVGVMVLIAVQVNIPSILPSTTLPGCVMSFSGFPDPTAIDTIDKSGLTYIACVLNMTKSNDQHSIWYSMNIMNPIETFMKNMEKIASVILKRKDIQQLYGNKNRYILENPTEIIIPQNQSLKKWTRFMPPIVKYSVNKTLQPVSISELFEDIRKDILKGHKQQWNMLGLIQTKNMQYSFAIFEHINNIVKKQNGLLTTSSGEFYLQNACCNENNKKQTSLQYFIEKESEIKEYIEHVKKLIDVKNYNNELSIASLFIETTDTRRKQVILPFNHTVENIYASIIHYCKFDVEDTPIPHYLRSFMHSKPSLNEYNVHWSLQEKINYLKENGKRFGEDDLNRLLLLVNEKNEVVKNAIEKEPFVIPNINKLVEYIDILENENNTVIPDVLRNHLMNILTLFRPNQYFLKTTEQDERTELLNKAKKYLQHANEKLQKSILSFMNKSGLFKESQLKDMKEYIESLMEWENNSEEQMPEIIQYVKNAIRDLTVLFPEIIINGKPTSNNVPSHWNLSDIHNNNIKTFTNDYYKSLFEFLKTKGNNENDDDEIDESKETTILLMKQIQNTTKVVHEFMENIPLLQSIKKKTKKEEFVFYSIFDSPLLYLLFTYLYYSVIYEYILIAKDKSIVKQNMLEIKKRKQNKKQKAVRNRDIENENNENDNDDDETIFGLNERIIETELRNEDILVVEKEIAKILFGCLNIERNNKKEINKSYLTVYEKVIHSKLEEKKKITDYLKEMCQEERTVEMQKKTYKMGRWNVGTEIYIYDKKKYDKEIMEETLFMNEDLQNQQQPLKTIQDLEKEQENQAKEEEDNEYIIHGDGEDEGVFYEDDRYNGVDDFGDD